MKPLLLACKLAILIGATSFIFLKLVAIFQTPLKIQSLESKTSTGLAVLNEITWFGLPEKDVWMMNQNHEGKINSENALDRLAIVIDKSINPPTAQFMQLPPGPLIWSDELTSKKIPFKVSCFTCHANGLRAIREDWNGLVKPAFFDKLKTNYFNLKIMMYGRVAPHAIHQQTDLNLETPFRHLSKLDNEVFKLKTCFDCHDGQKRSVLTRQNVMSISFLTKNGMMPPFGRTLSSHDQFEIQKFVNGF
jgi:hypothetical protein